MGHVHEETGRSCVGAQQQGTIFDAGRRRSIEYKPLRIPHAPCEAALRMIARVVPGEENDRHVREDNAETSVTYPANSLPADNVLSKSLFMYTLQPISIE